MPSTAHPTRQALLHTGLGLADSTELSSLSIDQVVEQTGVAKGTFYVHFKDRAAYLVALHRRFHDELRVMILARAGQLTPGPDRLREGARAYLDACLRARGVKAMLAQARGLPEIGREVASANDRFAHDIEPDLAAVGSPHPREAAQLFVAMAADVALRELDAGGPLPPLRASLLAYVGIDQS
jgi:TetR/AcrR family transcriptional repressor of nem operon